MQDYGFASVGRLLSQQTLHFVCNGTMVSFRHCEKSFSFSWQSIILNFFCDSIVSVFGMQDYGFALKRVKMLRICTLRLCLAMTQ